MVKLLVLLVGLALLLPAGVDFDTVDDILSCGSAADIDNMTPLTFAWRMRLDGSGESGAAGGYVFWKTDAAVTRYIYLYYQGDSGQLRFKVQGATALYEQVWAISTSTIPKTYVMVWDGGSDAGSTILYENGSLVSSAGGTFSAPGTRGDEDGNLEIGNRSSDTARTFNGVFGCMALWTATATANDIALLSHGGCRQTVQQTSLGTPLRFWPMDQGQHGVAVGTVMDESGNVGHCTPSNNPAFEAIQVGY